jgi:hypothetical protein
MKIEDIISKIKLFLFTKWLSKLSKDNSIAVSDILGIILVLLIIASTVSTILFWGVPYMQDQKAFVAQENALLQFDAMGDLIDDAFAEGVFFYDDKVANSSKTMTFKLSGGHLNLNNQGERFVIWYSFFDQIEIDVFELDPNEDDYSFSIDFIEDTPLNPNVNIYYIYDRNLLPEENIPINNPILTRDPIRDAVKIDVKDGNIIIGRIWLFDVGSINYKSTGPSNVYNAVVENGGVLATGDRTSGYFFNEPKFWPQTLLDNSSLLTMRFIQIKKDTGQGIDSIGGTSAKEVKFWIQPNCSLIKETKRNINGSLKMRIYGDNDAVSAWRYFYKNRVGFQSDDIDEPLYWMPPRGAKNVLFTLTHSICYINIEL